MDTNNTRLDDELAALTDALLDGKNLPPTGDLEGLDTIARQLSRVVSPGDVPDPAFHARLTQRLSQEWDAAQARPTGNPFASLSGANRRRYLALAAILVAVIGLAIFVIPRGPLTGSTVSSGEFSWPIIIVLAAVLGVAGYILWRRQR